MISAQELRELLSDWAEGDDLALGALVAELVEDLASRREADERGESDVLLLAECSHSWWMDKSGSETVELIHNPTGAIERAPSLSEAMRAMRERVREIRAAAGSGRDDETAGQA